jgi:hypothetical protein
VGTAAGANRVNIQRDHERRKSNTGRRADQATERHSYTVTDGRDAIGRIEQDGHDFAAYALPAESRLGVFGTMKAAARAISTAHGEVSHA